MPTVPALPAATVTLVRDTADGMEVLMLQRNHQSGFMPGMFLFPGGAIDPGDQHAAVVARCQGLDDAAASAALGLATGGLAYWAAAIRESFEEAAVLLAYGEDDALVNPGHDDRRERYAEYRRKLNAGSDDAFPGMLEQEKLRLATDRLTYFSHWITPVTAPRRYDTRFFAAVAPADQEAAPDNVEAIHHVWVRPPEAVERHRAGEFKMRTPTIRTLELFAPFTTADSLITHLRSLRNIPAILPRIGTTGKRLLPGEPGYEELSASEAQGPWKK
jgi:8-oxo-dGTP pyrophosphatase MutT (NUDIX family)